MYKLVDLTNLKWVTSRKNGASYGCYYKATDIIDGHKYYYKCSQFYSGQQVFGDESIFEVICSRLFSILGFDCVKYTLVYAKVCIDGMIFNTYVCKSKNFFEGYDSRMTLEDLHSFNKGITVNDIICKYNFQSQVCKMIIADFLTIQRDRHGGNIEVLIKGNNYRLAPLFDNGISFVAPYPSALTNSISMFDVMFDYPVNNYIGVRSLYGNLDLLQAPVYVNRLIDADRGRLFYNLSDIISSDYLDKVWQIIVQRYKYLRMRGVIID